MTTTGIEPTCGGCGATMSPRRTICHECGWDLTAAPPASAREPLRLRAGAILPRLVLWFVVLALPLLGAWRLARVGPGPDLPTTLRWLALGDGGRAAGLVTLHRAHEIGSAAARYAVRELEPFTFEGEWRDELAPYATMRIRGWIPMLFVAADTDMAPAGVREIYEIEAVDGWGRPYRVESRVLERGDDPRELATATGDLEAGLQRSFFSLETPDFDAVTGWQRLALDSAGADGDLDTPDDIRFVTWIPVGFTFRVRGTDSEQLRRERSAAYTRGRHYFRFDSPAGDLVDARLLAEFRLGMAR